MSEYVKVNGKKMPADEALALLEREETKVNTVTIGWNNPDRKDDLPLTNEGFAIPKEIIGGLSEKMDECDAESITWRMLGSPYIKGRNLVLTIKEPKPKPTWLKSKLIRLGEWLIK